MTNNDEYISAYDGELKERMVTLRAVIHSCHPDITEKIAWGMPTFVLKGNLLCGEEAYGQRQTWGELNPVTRKPANSKAYNRNKARNWKREVHETNSGTFLTMFPLP